jgi:hypothetical protein
MSLAIQGVPGGGSVALAISGYRPSPTVYRLVWMDGAGSKRAEAVLGTTPSPGFVVAASGDVVAFAGGQARWYGRDGAPRTDWFGYDTSGGSNEREIFGAAVLADGSVVVGLGTARALRFVPGVPEAATPPSWVTDRTGATIAAVRGNRANAFATVEQREPCKIRIEVLTASGESCGTVRLEAPRCDRVTFGADRTVFALHQGYAAIDSSYARNLVCTWSWWTGLLR